MRGMKCFCLGNAGAFFFLCVVSPLLLRAPYFSSPVERGRRVLLTNYPPPGIISRMMTNPDGFPTIQTILKITY